MLEMQIPGLHSTTDSEISGSGHSSQLYNKPPRWFQCIQSLSMTALDGLWCRFSKNRMTAWLTSKGRIFLHDEFV